MSWQRLSSRLGKMEPDAPFEGVPAHLKYPLVTWLRERLGTTGTQSPYRVQVPLIQSLRLRFRWLTPLNVSWYEHGEELIHEAVGGDDSFDVEDWNEDAVTNHSLFLDLIDATLDILGEHQNDWSRLDKLLVEGNSAWRVSEDRRSLVRRVGDEAQETYAGATSVSDSATKELQSAWRKAFSRTPDPSGAWADAIKAVEDVLIPIVTPNNAKATLSNVAGELGGQNGDRWEFVLPGSDKSHDVGPFVSMLRLIWPNHDRHGGSVPKRAPSEREARAVVTLATTIVQWHRDGWLVQRRQTVERSGELQ